MGKFPELSNEEIFDVLLCGGKPRGYGYTIQDYIDEWNDRVAHGERFDATTIKELKEKARHIN